MTQRLFACFFAVAVFAICGCQGEGFKLVPAEGVLKINGKEAANISVQFLPDVRNGAKGPTSTATTDEQGKFVLTTMDGRKGAVVGNHMVVLVDPDEERPAQGQRPVRKARIDPKYASPITSGLTAQVTEGGGPISLTATAP